MFLMTTLAPIHTIKLTTDQYFELGEDPPGTRLELIDGEIIVSPSPSRSHASIVFALAYLLETHLRQHHLGQLYLDTDVIFSRNTARRPDIAYFPNPTLALMTQDRLTAVPTLCVEVLSPSNEDDDRINKFHLYQSSGVAHYWIVDPAARTLQAYTLVDGVFQAAGLGRDGDIVRFAPFPDLAIPLADLWSRP
jgi:Uma2 family endonuclease